MITTSMTLALASGPLVQVTAGPPHWNDRGGFVPCLVFGLVVLGLLAAAAFWWFRRRPAGGPAGGGAGGARSAEDILAERYANGEISDDEYLQRQSVLRDDRKKGR